MALSRYFKSLTLSNMSRNGKHVYVHELVHVHRPNDDQCDVVWYISNATLTTYFAHNVVSVFALKPMCENI